MFLADLRPADPFSLEPAGFDQGAGEVPGRALEKAAGARVFEGLLFPPAGKIVLHAGGDKLPFIRCQAETGFRHHAAGLHQHTVTVSELQLFSRGLPRLPCPGDHRHAGEHIGHLAAIGAGVHVHPAADRPRDAEGELQP